MRNRDRETNDEALDKVLSRLYRTPEPPEGFDATWRAAVRREESMQMKNTSAGSNRRFWRAAIPAFAALVLVAGSLWTGAQNFGLPATGSGTTARETGLIIDASYDGGASITAKSAGGGANGMDGMSARSSGPILEDAWNFEADGTSVESAVSMDSASMDSAAGMADYAPAGQPLLAASEVADSATESAPESTSESGTAQGEATQSEAGQTEAAQSEAAQTGAAQTERKLVRTADLTIRTTAFETDAASVQALLKQMGGYVENLYQYGDTQSGGTRTLTLSTRVPAQRLDEFLTGLGGIGRVTDRSESSTDMSVQYADNAARLQTLREKMSRLTELLKQAENVSDLVEIENAIADTQYQIDSYETDQRGIDRRVGMSAVSVTVMEETPAQSAAAVDTSLGARISAGLSASVKWLGEFFRNMLVFVVMALPVLIPVAIAGLIVWLCVRRRRAGKAHGSDEESNRPEKES